MKALLNASGKSSADRSCNRRQQRHLFLNVARQRADDQNADHEHNRTDKQQQLRPATNGDEVERRVSAAEDQHLAEVFQREERNERQHRHHEQRHDVARAWNAPVSFSEIFVTSSENACEADEERDLRRFPRRHVAERFTGARRHDRDRQRQQCEQDDDETVALQPQQEPIARAKRISDSEGEEREDRNPRVTGSDRVPERVVRLFLRKLVDIDRLCRRGRQAHHLLLHRIVVLHDVARAQRLHLFFARGGFVARVVFRIAVEAILDQHAEREEQNRGGEEDPVAGESFGAREPDREEHQRERTSTGRARRR